MNYTKNLKNVNPPCKNKKPLKNNNIKNSFRIRLEDVLKKVKHSEVINFTKKQMKEECMIMAGNAYDLISGNKFDDFLISKDERYGVDFSEYEIKRYFKNKKEDTKFRITMMRKSIDSKFWFQRLKKLQRRKIEEVQHHLKRVGHKANHYCSKQTITNFLKREEENRKFLENKIITDGKVKVSLADCERTEYHRFAEFYTYIRAIEDYAKKLKFDWCFITLTLPPEYHINGKSKKTKWNEVEVKESHNILADKWHKIKSILTKKGVKNIGVRVVEAHKDGTPHWHIMLFYDGTLSSFEKIRYAVKYHFPLEIKAKRKTKKYRKGELVVEQGQVIENNDEASAASYITKYISKGFKEDSNNNDEDKITNDDLILAAKAWRNTFGIRAFQFFGLKRIITKIRLLRKARKLGDNKLIKIATGRSFTDLIIYFNENKDSEGVFEYIKKKYKTKYGEIKEKITGFILNRQIVKEDYMKTVYKTEFYNFEKEWKEVMDAKENKKKEEKKRKQKEKLLKQWKTINIIEKRNTRFQLDLSIRGVEHGAPRKAAANDEYYIYSEKELLKII